MKLENGKLYVGFMPEGDYIGIYNKKTDTLDGLFGVDVANDNVTIIPAKPQLFLVSKKEGKLVQLNFQRVAFQGFISIDVMEYGDMLKKMYVEVATGMEMKEDPLKLTEDTTDGLLLK